MVNSLRLMAVLAHPDDEALGFGGTLAKCAAEGIETYLVTATRGERGWLGDERTYPGPEALGRTREAELAGSARVLGMREVQYLDYVDAELDQAHPAEAIAKIVGHLRRVRPQVVVTFDPYGAYGHPDHIAISQFALAAIVAAADANYAFTDDATPHRVDKFYYRVDTEELLVVYQSVFGDLVMRIDGVERRGSGWPTWAFTTEIDTAAYWPTVWKAVKCHTSQLPSYAVLAHLSERDHRALWGTQRYYRAFSLVNGGRQKETDLFAGIR
jgi:LmbE family N-acetylglucosaminyl deacetylase